jgi:hypothetical protein
VSKSIAITNNYQFQNSRDFHTKFQHQFKETELTDCSSTLKSAGISPAVDRAEMFELSPVKYSNYSAVCSQGNGCNPSCPVAMKVKLHGQLQSKSWALCLEIRSNIQNYLNSKLTREAKLIKMCSRHQNL